MELEVGGILVSLLLKVVCFSYLCHGSRRTFRCVIVPSMKAPAGAVEAIGLNVAQVPVHGREHSTALKLPIAVDGQGEVLLPLLSQVPSIQDPVGVAAVREAPAHKHLTDGLKGGEEDGQTQDEQQLLLEATKLADLPNDIPESAHADGWQRNLIRLSQQLGMTVWYILLIKATCPISNLEV